MSSALALQEKCKPVPDTPATADELKHVIRGMANRLNVSMTLSGWKHALQVIEQPAHSQAAYFLLALDYQEKTLSITSYKQRAIDRATEAYGLAERRLEGRGSAVLVRAENPRQLKRAYPSYYSDTDLFLQYLNRITA